MIFGPALYVLAKACYEWLLSLVHRRIMQRPGFSCARIAYILAAAILAIILLFVLIPLVILKTLAMAS